MPSPYPIVVGHEIVGRAIKVGKDVQTGIKVGNRVGVGTSATACAWMDVVDANESLGGQSGACLKPECERCSHDFEQHCSSMVQTYGMNGPNGEQARGGFAKYWRGDGKFVFALPRSLPSEAIAPMLCGEYLLLPQPETAS